MHQFDPNRRPDADYEPGRLDHLVPGNVGRALDPRRTPVRITAVETDSGFFTLELLAFEDAGATWEIPFERIEGYQFERGCTLASPADVAACAAAVARLDQRIEIDAPADARVETEKRLDELVDEVKSWLVRHSRFFAHEEQLDTSARRGPASLADDLRAFMRDRHLLDVEEAFAAQYVRNPHSGETIKGHRIVLAELGLVPYQGSIVRDPTLFDGAWSKGRRAEHIVFRLAFVRAALARASLETLIVYRGIAVDGAIRPPDNETFVSASFDFEVARSCFGETDRLRTGALFRQAIPLRRAFMTYLETREMNQRYLESEAVLLYDPSNPIF